MRDIMKRIFVLIIAAITLLGADMAVAQSRTSYFMEGSPYRNDLNPALAPTRGFVALPGFSGIGLNATTNFMSVDNFLYQKDGQLVTALHGSVSSEEFFNKLPNLGKATLDFKTNIFSVGFYAKKMYWTFGINADVSGDMAMSMDMFKAIKTLGNGTFDLGATAIDMNAYMDAYLGTSFRVHDNVNIGIKAKFLVGIANLEANFSELAANVTPDEVNATLHGSWRANGVFIDKAPVKAGNSLPISDILRYDPSYILSTLNNFGAAIDLGAEVRLLDNHLKISAAVTDLGFIKWSGDGHIAGTAEGNFLFNGMNLEAEELAIDSDFDMLVSDAVENKGYISMLNFSLNAGVEYNILNNHIAFGLMSHTKFCKTMTYSELIASVNFRATNWLTATFSHTFLNGNRPGVLGFALNIHPRVINIFVGADFIDTRYVKGPTVGGMNTLLGRYQQSLNLYAGITFNFARPKFMRGKK